jgi:hypothetical protein
MLLKLFTVLIILTALTVLSCWVELHFFLGMISNSFEWLLLGLLSVLNGYFIGRFIYWNYSLVNINSNF